MMITTSGMTGIVDNITECVTYTFLIFLNYIDIFLICICMSPNQLWKFL